MSTTYADNYSTQSLVEKKKQQWAREREELAGLHDNVPWGSRDSLQLYDKPHIRTRYVTKYQKENEYLRRDSIPETPTRRPSLPPLYKNQNITYTSNEKLDKEMGGETSGYGSDNPQQIPEYFPPANWTINTMHTNNHNLGYESSTSSSREDRAKWGDRGVLWEAKETPRTKMMNNDTPGWVKRGLERDSELLVSNQSPAESPEQDCGERPCTGTSNSMNRSYIRGQNVPVEPIELAERERRRQIALEHQEAVREQLQEREKRRQIEKKRKLREEYEEEQRIIRENELERQRKERENRLRDEKQERDRRRKEALREAIAIAEKQAREEKQKILRQNLININENVAVVDKFNLPPAENNQTHKHTDAINEKDLKQNNNYETKNHYKINPTIYNNNNSPVHSQTASIHNNNGSIHSNVSIHSNDGSIHGNNGSIRSNNGSIHSNNATIRSNGASYNNNNDSIQSNAVPIHGNNESIHNNTMHSNNGSIHSNNGSIHNNNVSIHNNNDSIHSNKGTIHSNSGSIHNNNDSIHNNNDSIHSINGTIHSNSGSIHNNNSIHSNDSIHSNSGSIHNNNGSIHSNNGSIHSNSGPIHNNSNNNSGILNNTTSSNNASIQSNSSGVSSNNSSASHVSQSSNTGDNNINTATANVCYPNYVQMQPDVAIMLQNPLDAFTNMQFAILMPQSNQYVAQSSERSVRTENRILTPTQYRNNKQVCDSSTQTDLSEFNKLEDKYLREKMSNLEINYESSRGGRGKDRRSRSELHENVEDRPKWGVNRPPTRYLKQSEKDPVYQRRKMRQKIKQIKVYDIDNHSSDESQASPRTYRKKGYTEKRQSRALWRKNEHLFAENVRVYQTEIVPIESDKDHIYFKTKSHQCCCRCQKEKEKYADHVKVVDILKIEHNSPRECLQYKSELTQEANRLPECNKPNNLDDGSNVLEKLSSLHHGLMRKQEQWDNPRHSFIYSPSRNP